LATLYVLTFSPSRLCEFCLLDTGSAAMYAEGRGIGFVYAHVAAHSPFPHRLVNALDPARWAGTEPVASALLNEGNDVAVYTGALRGDPVPYILVDPLHAAPAVDVAACDFLSKFDESILDASLSSFTARVFALVARFPAQREYLVNGLLRIHIARARSLGLGPALESVNKAGGVALAVRRIGAEEALVRMGPAEIDVWLAKARHADPMLSAEWEAQLASDFAQSALPQLPGPVYLQAKLCSSAFPESVILCLPDDSAAIRPEWLPEPPPARATQPSNVIALPVRQRPPRHRRHDDSPTG
jgi:hypothetical protein